MAHLESDGDADNNCNAKRCKKYRSKLTSEQREVNKQKDRERKRCFNSVINKGQNKVPLVDRNIKF